MKSKLPAVDAPFLARAIWRPWAAPNVHGFSSRIGVPASHATASCSAGNPAKSRAGRVRNQQDAVRLIDRAAGACHSEWTTC